MKMDALKFTLLVAVMVAVVNGEDGCVTQKQFQVRYEHFKKTEVCDSGSLCAFKTRVFLSKLCLNFFYLLQVTAQVDKFTFLCAKEQAKYEFCLQAVLQLLQEQAEVNAEQAKIIQQQTERIGELGIALLMPHPDIRNGVHLGTTRFCAPVVPRLAFTEVHHPFNSPKLPVVVLFFFTNSTGAAAMQNLTIDERVSILEIQVVEIFSDVEKVEEATGFLFDEQVIQDQRLFALEQDADELDDEVEALEDDFSGWSFLTLQKKRWFNLSFASYCLVLADLG